MAVNDAFITWVCDQMSEAGEITSRKMFGGCAIYCDAKVVALVDDGMVFVKPTDAGRAHAAGIPEAPPYPGGKPWLAVTDRLDDRQWISSLVRITARSLPAPKPKTPKKAAGKQESASRQFPPAKPKDM